MWPSASRRPPACWLLAGGRLAAGAACNGAWPGPRAICGAAMLLLLLCVASAPRPPRPCAKQQALAHLDYMFMVANGLDRLKACAAVL